MKKVGKIWLWIGLVPYILTMIYSIYAIYNGISNCVVGFEKYRCDVYYGLSGFAQTWYMAIYILYPIYLVFLFFIILGLSKTRRTEHTEIRSYLSFGISPFLLAMFLLIFACIADPNTSISTLFVDIFMKHFFVVVSELIGIILILIGVVKMQILENKGKKSRQ